MELSKYEPLPKGSSQILKLWQIYEPLKVYLSSCDCTEMLVESSVANSTTFNSHMPEDPIFLV